MQQLSAGRQCAEARGAVKSAVRTVAILEYPDRCRMPASVGQIANALGFPRSSTSALLHSLVSVGYPNFDFRQRSYAPSERVPLLGGWVSSRLTREGPLPRLARALAERLGCAAMLMMRLGDFAQCIHFADPQEAASAPLGHGCLLPLPGTAPGDVLLSHMEDSAIGRLVRRLNAQAAQDGVVPVSAMLTQVRAVRSQGYARTEKGGRAMIAVPIPSQADEAPLVMTLAGRAGALGDAVPALLATLGRVRTQWPDRVTSFASWPQVPPTQQNARGMARVSTGG